MNANSPTTLPKHEPHWIFTVWPYWSPRVWMFLELENKRDDSKTWPSGTKSVYRLISSVVVTVSALPQAPGHPRAAKETAVRSWGDGQMITCSRWPRCSSCSSVSRYPSETQLEGSGRPVFPRSPANDTRQGIWYGMVWYGMVCIWYGTVWYSLVP